MRAGCQKYHPRIRQLAWEHLGPGYGDSLVTMNRALQHIHGERPVPETDPHYEATALCGYMPIVVLLYMVGKFFERVTADRIVAQLSRDRPDLADSQIGFRRRYYTMDAMVCVRAL
ncbi:hypothetical protein PYW08_006938 [Mythimna loreyi]|uniref:Uncharacterized protein n=1 Tax=Mythimna loreyi TaxID=667449 RepID=A0ACC2R8X1_9NEOP|nr:hypothetical protein PYW08_006938 [Mythimna loreyi]